MMSARRWRMENHASLPAPTGTLHNTSLIGNRCHIPFGREQGTEVRAAYSFPVEPTLELVLQPPAVGNDPLAALVITLAAVWILGAPWLRLCWWLGTRARRHRLH